MNAVPDVRRRPSVCPHGCPSVCALDVEAIDGERIGRIRGAPAQTCTAGVICAKVARCSERIHHPDRLAKPLRRVGPKGAGQFIPVDWDEAFGWGINALVGDDSVAPFGGVAFHDVSVGARRA